MGLYNQHIIKGKPISWWVRNDPRVSISRDALRIRLLNRDKFKSDNEILFSPKWNHKTWTSRLYKIQFPNGAVMSKTMREWFEYRRKPVISLSKAYVEFKHEPDPKKRYQILFHYRPKPKGRQKQQTQHDNDISNEAMDIIDKAMKSMNERYPD